MDKITISTFQLFQMFPDKESARVYFESRMWPQGVRCPVCAATENITTRKRVGFYRCNQCHEDFTVCTGTIFERSHIPLHKWCVALAIIANQPEIPSQLLSQKLQVTQKTGWLVLSRVREAADDLFVRNLTFDDPRYRVLADWIAYRVGEDGSIWTRWRRGRGGRLGFEWRAMEPTLDKDGYRIVRLYGARGAWKQQRVCRLVCGAFHGQPEAGQEVRHLDGDPANDAQTNLVWGTSLENHDDMKRHGTQPKGETHHNATLTDQQIGQILSLKGKLKQREVAAQFGTTQSYVSELWSGRKRLTFARLTA